MEETTKKTGRPSIEIDEKQFESLCALQCTLNDIAAFFECSPDTIERWCKKTYDLTFADIYKKKRVKGFVSLRKYQFDLAKSNVAMAIWLGKQYLNQVDKQEVRTDDKVIVVNNVPTKPKDGEK